MAAVLLPPHPEPRRPALRLVVSTPHEPAVVRSRRPAPRRRTPALYRRRRALVALVGLTVVLLGWAAAGALTAPAGERSVVTAGSSPIGARPAAAPEAAPPAVPQAAPQVYVVRPGDTVWSIAERLRPDGDVRDLVDQLTERAGGSGLQAGQRIALDGLAV
jgi:hypothetical protein